ncbi:MAG TPA: peptide-N-glycosidase F-related protein, partial [Bacteroidia bacterium]
EGTPERNVIGYSQLYSGSYSYGIPTDPIGFHLLTKSFTAPAGTKTAELKYTVTGHGSDNTTQCCEFAAHSYTVNLNGAAIASQRVWRNDCGWNELYPQGGTWIYNRSNWCPGATVNKYTHKLNGITALSNFSLRTVYDNYTTSGNYGNYFIEGHVVYFGAINHYLDVSMEDVIAPTNYEGYFRENPSGMNPVVKIHNAGSAIINTIDFSYGVKDSVLNYYTWNGTLAALTDTLITLPPLAALKNLSVSNSGGLHLFTANVLAVNGFTDEDTTNNSMSKLFYAAPKWPNKFLVTLNTNSQGVNSVGVNPSQTSYTISDSAGNVLFSRTNLNVNSTYADTVTLPANAFYKLSISDLGCDGLHWWVWDQNPGSGVTAGSFTVKNISNNALIAMNGYNYTGTFNNDFGCGFVQYFTTANASTSSVQEANMNWNNRVKIFPNPANNLTRIVIDGYKGNQKGELEVLNAQGQTMLRKTMDGIAMDMNTEGLADGIYTVVCRKGNNLMFTGKLVVAR